MKRLQVWRKTVAGKTALGVVVPLVAVFGGFLAYKLIVRREQAREQVVQSHSHHAVMLEELLRASIRATGGHDLDGLVRAVREAERYSEVLIADNRGVVGHARDPASVGRQLERSRPECALCHREDGVRAVFEPVTLVVDEAGERVLRTVVPLRNYPDCHRCHGTDVTITGIAVLEAPMTELDQLVDRLVWETVLTSLSLLLVAGAGIYAAQHRLVVRPLSRLTAQARDVERGGPHRLEKVTSDTEDEVGQLAAAVRRMVDRLAEAQAELQDKVRVRTAELSQMGEELERLNSKLMHVERLTTMGELAATIAHEVRTPLNALAINLQLLKRQLRAAAESPGPCAETVGPSSGRDTVAILEGEIARINAVVEEFMKYARLPRPRLQPLDLNVLAAGSIQLLELEARRAGVSLGLVAHPEPLEVHADEDQLRQVLINLVLNALQAVSQGGRIQICAAVKEGKAQLSVEDDGPGISGEVMESMFKAFFTTKEKGTGLGLAIAARIVREHGGTLRAESVAGGGARFELLLPLDEEPADATALAGTEVHP